MAKNANVTLGIRPRAFELAAEPSSDTLSATADIIEPMGAETLIHMLTNDADVRVVLRRGIRINVGEQVHLRCKPNQAHVFDDNERLLRL